MTPRGRAILRRVGIAIAAVLFVAYVALNLWLMWLGTGTS